MKVIKKGNLVEFERNKIRNAIIAAWNQVELPNFKRVDEIVGDITEELINWNEDIPVEEIENLVMSYLYRLEPEVARSYSAYKMDKERAKNNPTPIEEVLYVSPEINTENGNKDANLSYIKNAYLAEIPSAEFMKQLLPDECLEAHERGVVYYHDLSYSARPLTNCCLFNLEDIFKGCKINNVFIETPKSFLTACTVATQALSQATNQQYGGITINLLHLAKFVDVSRQKIRRKVREELSLLPLRSVDSEYINDQINKIVEKRLADEISQGMQTFLYQNNTLCGGTGQAAFLSVSVWLSEDPKYSKDLILVFEEMLRQRIAGIKQEDGTTLNPNFPKILYFLDEDTMRGGKYYETTKLCAECSAKRLVPDYLSVKKHRELKQVPTAPMGCRSLLHPWQNEEGDYVTYGRGNLGVQSLNLPYIAMENNPERSQEIFFKNLEHYLDIAHRDMLWRANHCAKIKAGQSPLMWCYGGLLRLEPEETLEKYVYNGYFSISLGFCGIYECVKYLTGENQFTGEGNILAHKIFDTMNASNDKFKAETGLAAGLYGTPMETTTDKFASACIRDFGHIGDGSQRHFLTNSYHYYVGEEVDAFTKLSDETQFSDKTLSGSISYCEVPNMSNNLDAMLELIEHIGNTCLYAEVNSEISSCTTCGFEGYDFKKIAADDGTVRWQCPHCGETDPAKVKTSYRICGLN